MESADNTVFCLGLADLVENFGNHVQKWRRSKFTILGVPFQTVLNFAPPPEIALVSTPRTRESTF